MDLNTISLDKFLLIARSEILDTIHGFESHSSLIFLSFLPCKFLKTLSYSKKKHRFESH